MKDVLYGAGDLDQKTIESLANAASNVTTSTGSAAERSLSGFRKCFHGILRGFSGLIKHVIFLIVIPSS